MQKPEFTVTNIIKVFKLKEVIDNDLKEMINSKYVVIGDTSSYNNNEVQNETRTTTT